MRNALLAGQDDHRDVAGGLVAAEERSVDEIAMLLSVKPPTASHHLSKLKECGLVIMRVEGNVHFYSLNEKRLSALLRDLSPKVLKEVSEDVDTSSFDRKVVQDGAALLLDGDVRDALVPQIGFKCSLVAIVAVHRRLLGKKLTAVKSIL